MTNTLWHRVMQMSALHSISMHCLTLRIGAQPRYRALGSLRSPAIWCIFAAVLGTLFNRLQAKKALDCMPMFQLACTMHAESG